MKWVGYTDIANALMRDAIPKGKIYDSEHSTPDVYGRAIQHYITLWEAQQRGDYNADAVRAWRGFLTLLALRSYLDIPLFWRRVDLTEEIRDRNLFYLALEHPNQRRERLLFPDNPRWIWDGRLFYALQWVPANGNPTDILIFSPYSLICPVAGWREKLKRIVQEPTGASHRGKADTSQRERSESSRILSRFFDPEGNPKVGIAPGFRPLGVRGILNSGEPEMLCYYLGKLLDSFGSETNDAQRTIGEHIKKFQSELVESYHVSLNRHTAFALRPFPTGKTDPVQQGWIPEILQNSVGTGTLDRHFSDQICYFKTDSNPFAEMNPITREFNPYSSLYEIRNTPQGQRWFAFLPIHPDHRRDCVSSGLARSVTMTLTGEPGKERISATMNLEGQTIGMDYLLSPVPTMETRMAVPLNSRTDGGEPDKLTVKNWPGMAIWPGKIGSDWKEYYVMMCQDVGQARLQIYNLVDLLYAGDSAASTGQDTAIRKTSEYVVKTSYVPDAIPLAKRDYNGRTVSVGMVMPPTVPEYTGLRNVVANVAVDFGTSSTRVFASVDEKAVEEIGISGNSPLEVIRYSGAADRENLIAREFIRPGSLSLWNERADRGSGEQTEEQIKKSKAEREEREKKIGRESAEEERQMRTSIREHADATLFSVFRKSRSDLELDDVIPMLDGNIYQPTTDETAENNGQLVTNLKWDLAGKGKYYIAFMKQLLLNITVNLNGRGVKQINWKYSLPRSMSERDKKEMTRIWTEEMQRYLDEISGTTIRHNIAKNAVSESVAASRYFLREYKEEVHSGKGFLVIDIGGGSTDAALWQNRGGKLSLLWQDSVTIAGQKMCTQWLERSIHEIDNAMRRTSAPSKNEFSALVGTIPDTGDVKKKETRDALVDRLLTFYSLEMRDSFKVDCENQGGIWGIRLYEQIAQGISLMMFALGCQVGALYAAGRFTIPQDSGFFSIAFGGRGAGMMDWLECLDRLPYAREREEETLAKFFRSGMALGRTLQSSAAPAGEEDAAPDCQEDGLNAEIRILRNRKDPKCEVARGLLVTEYGGEQDATRESKPLNLRRTFYEDAADKFVEVFREVFRIGDEGGIQGQLVEIPDMDRNKLAGLAERFIPTYGADLQEVFRILMKVAYTYLEGAVQ